jgi:hypothetical protein
LKWLNPPQQRIDRHTVVTALALPLRDAGGAEWAKIQARDTPGFATMPLPE